KGNSGGPGNPFGRKIAALRAALLNTVTEQDIREITAALLLCAKEGDVAAARMLLAYTIGKPAGDTEPIDGQARRASPARAQTAQGRTQEGMPVDCRRADADGARSRCTVT